MLFLAFKAEMVLGWQLVSRHRAPRLAAVLGLSLLAMIQPGPGDPADLLLRQRAVIVAASLMGLTAGSRLLARGGALACARQSCGRWWLAATGRLCGVLVPVAAASVFGSVAIGARPPLATAAAAVLAAAAAGALVMSLAPVVGASGAAALGLVGAVLPLSPGGAALLEAAPLVRSFALPALDLLPAQRALDLLRSPAALDLLCLLAWTAGGLALAGWAAARAPAAA